MTATSISKDSTMHATELEQTILRHEGYLRFDQDDMHLRITLGDLYHRAHRIDEATACYRSCLERSPRQPVARARLAAALIAQGHIDDAEDILAELITTKQKDLTLTHNLGMIHFLRQHWEQALECFALAAQGGLRHATNYEYMTRALHRLQLMDDAIESGKLWVQMAQDAASKSYLSLLYAQMGDFAKAGALAHEALALTPGDIDARLVYAQALLERFDLPGATVHFCTVLAACPNNASALFGLGLCSLHEERLDAAISLMERAVLVEPESVGKLVMLGWAQLLALRVDSAEQTFMRAIGLDASCGEAHGGMASVCAMREQSAAAIAHIALARRLKRSSFGAAFARATVLAWHGKGERAQRSFQKLYGAMPPGQTPSTIQYLVRNEEFRNVALRAGTADQHRRSNRAARLPQGAPSAPIARAPVAGAR
jgi:tetratricopeptide (TPR) repeat protein